MEILLAMGVPTAITGLFVWIVQRHYEKREREREKQRVAAEHKREEKERNMERWMLLSMQTNRATNILVEATARAVQRIPDAHCNGDMKAALEQAAKIQKEEKDFIFDHGVKHIFGD